GRRDGAEVGAAAAGQTGDAEPGHRSGDADERMRPAVVGPEVDPIAARGLRRGLVFAGAGCCALGFFGGRLRGRGGARCGAARARLIDAFELAAAVRGRSARLALVGIGAGVLHAFQTGFAVVLSPARLADSARARLLLL